MVLAASPRETVYASGPAATALEELTLTLGEGPGMDALHGELGREQLTDALMLADTAGALLLASAARPLVGPEESRHRPARPPHRLVHQATGMVSVQLGVSLPVALIRLRGYAYAHERQLREVAAEVVARRLWFDPETPDR